MGSFIYILDTQKKFEFQGISNFKDSEFEETKCINIYRIDFEDIIIKL